MRASCWRTNSSSCLMSLTFTATGVLSQLPTHTLPIPPLPMTFSRLRCDEGISGDAFAVSSRVDEMVLEALRLVSLSVFLKPNTAFGRCRRRREYHHAKPASRMTKHATALTIMTMVSVVTKLVLDSWLVGCVPMSVCVRLDDDWKSEQLAEEERLSMPRPIDPSMPFTYSLVGIALKSPSSILANAIPPEYEAKSFAACCGLHVHCGL
mmetsp:Transcript_35029/g.57979  ORF Transcript_35029/g.57979 Transcript_35029/m.57979 type:complete len:209 (-) Transcript_35029:1890-2516(-)